MGCLHSNYGGEIMFKTMFTALIAAACFSPLMYADVEGEIGLGSDYFWRGMSQNAGSSAVSAGLKLENSGFYGSVWASQVDFGTDTSWEWDLTAGYDLKVTDDFSVGGGVIQYNYDKVIDDVEELFVTTAYKDTSVTYYVDTDNRDNTYLEVRQGLSFIEPVNVAFEYGENSNGMQHVGMHVGKQVGKVYLNLMIMDNVRHGKASDSAALSLIYNF